MTEERQEELEEVEVEFRRVPVDAISQSKFVLRRVGNERKMEELRLSIARRGVLVPIVATETEEGFELIAGRRRLLCAQALGLAEIPALVVKASREWRAWACLTENRVREQVNPVDEGLWMAEVMEEQGINQRALAERLEVSEQYVGQRLSTMRWPDDVRDAVLEGKIGFAVGRELWQITEEEHRKHLLRVAVVSGCTARQAGDWRRAWQREKELGYPEGAEVPSEVGAESREGLEGQCSLCQRPIESGTGERLLVCDTCSEAARVASSS